MQPQFSTAQPSPVNTVQPPPPTFNRPKPSPSRHQLHNSLSGINELRLFRHRHSVYVSVAIQAFGCIHHRLQLQACFGRISIILSATKNKTIYLISSTIYPSGQSKITKRLQKQKGLHRTIASLTHIANLLFFFFFFLSQIVSS